MGSVQGVNSSDLVRILLYFNSMYFYKVFCKMFFFFKHQTTDATSQVFLVSVANMSTKVIFIEKCCPTSFTQFLITSVYFLVPSKVVGERGLVPAVLYWTTVKWLGFELCATPGCPWMLHTRDCPCQISFWALSRCMPDHWQHSLLLVMYVHHLLWLALKWWKTLVSGALPLHFLFRYISFSFKLVFSVCCRYLSI